MKSTLHYQMLILCFTFSLCVQTYGETILYFHTSPDDSKLTQTAKKRAQSLKNCGYNVLESNDFGKANWDNFLEKTNKSQPRAIFIEGHGVEITRDSENFGTSVQGKFFFTKGEEGTAININPRGSIAIEPEFTKKDGKIKSLNKSLKDKFGKMDNWERVKFLNQDLMEEGDNLISKIGSFFPKSTVWLDTCHASSVSVDSTLGMNVGIATAPDEKSYNESKLTDDLIELMCSSGPKGDCEAWKKVDSNGDGIVSDVEIQDAWKKKYQTANESFKTKKVITDLSEKQLLLSLGSNGKILTKKKVSNATYLSKMGTGNIVKDRKLNVEGVDKTGELDPVTVTGVPFPLDASEEDFKKWKEKVLSAANLKKELLPLKNANIMYVPPKYEYEIKEAVVLEPFSPFDKQELKKRAERDKAYNVTQSPRFRNFSLQGQKCATSVYRNNRRHDSEQH